jgi:hypothetical protein
VRGGQFTDEIIVAQFDRDDVTLNDVFAPVSTRYAAYLAVGTGFGTVGSGYYYYQYRIRFAEDFAASRPITVAWCVDCGGRTATSEWLQLPSNGLWDVSVELPLTNRAPAYNGGFGLGAGYTLAGVFSGVRLNVAPQYEYSVTIEFDQTNPDICDDDPTITRHFCLSGPETCQTFVVRFIHYFDTDRPRFRINILPILPATSLNNSIVNWNGYNLVLGTPDERFYTDLPSLAGRGGFAEDDDLDYTGGTATGAPPGDVGTVALLESVATVQSLVNALAPGTAAPLTQAIMALAIDHGVRVFAVKLSEDDILEHCDECGCPPCP